MRKYFNVSFLKKAFLTVQTLQFKLGALVSNYQLYILLAAY